MPQHAELRYSDVVALELKTNKSVQIETAISSLAHRNGRRVDNVRDRWPGISPQ